MAKTIMIQGTCSNAGKSLLCAALCRIFRQDGYRVAPFKSQNMALNSFITADGREMGRAQVVQAEAAGIAPDVRMNPILLKPTSDVGSQVIIMGEAQGNRTAREYWGRKKALLPMIKDAFDSLAAENDIIVIEGAGSPAEINLKQDDIVNMGLAKLVDAPVLLVGDIDRGGVFASLYGTVKLLDEDEQARIHGLIINKFRGDVEILRPGLTQLEDLTGKPVIGVVPYGHFDIDDEDSLSERLDAKAAPALVNIAVVKLPRLSNFTDFSALSRVSGVSVAYADKPAQLAGADLIILPGTKSTLADLRWLRESGMEAQILKAHAAGTPVFGICGGYQMGRTVSDPDNTEGGGSLRGMNLLPIDTVFRSNKTTTQTRGTLLEIDGVLSDLSGLAVEGYEIHMGETVRDASAKPLIRLRRREGEIEDGCQTENAFGTYLHGVFDARLQGAAVRQTGGFGAEIARYGVDLPHNGGKSMTGLIHIYCGDGKGKTTAAVGLAVRCAGRGNKVVFTQFLKDGTSGECRVLAKLPDVTVMAANPVGKFSFCMTDAEKRETADALTRTFDAATGFAVREHARLLVLDEVCAAISCGFLDEKTVVKFLETKPETLEVVLTGRGPSEALQAHADYITEMKMQRHPFEKGIAAREGIEF